MANFTSFKPTIGATWYTEYYAYVNAVEGYATQIDNANSAYGGMSLVASLTTLNANMYTQMQEYVQSVALTGVDPAEIGTANQVVTINSSGQGFDGIGDTELFNIVKEQVKKAILIYGD